MHPLIRSARPRRPRYPGRVTPWPTIHAALSASNDAPRKNDAEIDPRVWPIAASTFVTGSAIGVLLPVMPLFAASLNLTTAEFGLVGSVFGGTRLLANIPIAIASERYGRRPFLIFGPMCTAVAMVGTGLSGSLPALLLSRVLTGIGGSAQIAGAQLYLTDISRPENRARSLAPMSAAFNAGAALGPAIGGILAQVTRTLNPNPQPLTPNPRSTVC